MTLLSMRGIKKSYGNTDVLLGVDFDIGEGERIGLVGHNGAGKTTLADILAGSEKCDDGEIIWFRKGINIGYLAQSTFYTTNRLDSIFDRHGNADILKEFLQISSQLGLDKLQQWKGERIRGLSGGEKTKLALAEIWMTRPELLILDEPTNHLDFKGVEWLIEELNRYPGTLLIISHDRYFLDQTVQRIAELEEGKIRSFSGNYTFYREERKRLYEARLHQYTVEKREQQRIEEEIRRWRAWSEKAHREAGKQNLKSDGKQMGLKEYGRKKAKKMDIQVKSRIKRLEKVRGEGVEMPREDRQILFELESSGKRGKRVLEARSIEKSYGNYRLWQESSFFIQAGEKIGVFGENGSGKTTLLKAILNQERVDRGELWVSPSARIAYLSQDVQDMQEKQSSLEYLGIYRCARDADAWTLLYNMGFDETMLVRPIESLSLGERTRIKIAAMILRGNDFLLLDEPTNHLDLASREQLEDTLASYTGTLLVVSHDRYMLERTCDKMLVFKDQKIIRFEGGFTEYRERSKVKNAGDSGLSKNRGEILLVVENRIASILGELSTAEKGSPRYLELEEEFNALTAQIRQLKV